MTIHDITRLIVLLTKEKHKPAVSFTGVDCRFYASWGKDGRIEKT